MWSIIFHVSRLNSSKTLPTIIRNDFTPNIIYFSRYFKYFQRRHEYNLCTLCGRKTLHNDVSISKQRYFITRSNSLFTSHIVQKNKDNDEKQLGDITLLFPSPKTVLNNYYTMVSNELKIQNPMTIHYKSSVPKKSTNKTEWSCTYSIKWPSEHKTTASAATKTEASRKAALKLLVWLNTENKILKNGQPLLYNQDELKQIKKQTYIRLELDEATKKGLEQIRAEYETIKMQMDIESESDESIHFDDETGCVENIAWPSNQHNNSSIKKYEAVESMQLPIREYRQEIERLLEEKRVVIIRGEPGCGKSSYVPQYLLESWYRERPNSSARIAVTQPRRIAAISLAENVAAERGERAGDVVGYQVRLRSQFNPRTTRILYLTTGVLLRWMQRDPSLSSCTHVVVDEAHERDVNIDLLICMLKRALVENPLLKVCIMSATVDAQLFSKYFGNAPIVHVHGRKFPVKKYHLEEVARKLKLRLDRTASVNESDRTEVVADEVADVLHRLHMTADEGAILCFLPGWDEIGRVQRSLVNRPDLNTAVVLPLHGRLSNEQQRRIFERAPPGARKIILATNVAETSITVDDVVHVVDSGLHRLNRFDPERRLSSSRTEWINKSNAEQRAGRAGRVRPGFCYRLFTTERHRSMDEYPTPEILRAPLDKVLLDAKVFSRNADALDLFGKLPSPPSAAVVKSAVSELQRLQLLDDEGNVTRFGQLVSQFPMSPRLARALVQSVTYECVGPIVDIVTIFGNDSSEMFSSALAEKRAVRETKLAHCPTSDHMALTLIYEHWADLIEEGKTELAANFCKKYNLLPYKLHTLRKLRHVHLQYLENCLENWSWSANECSDTDEIIMGVLLSGVGNVLSHRSWDIVKGRMKKSDVFITSSGHKATVTPESVNAKDVENDSLFVYVNEVKSELRRSVLVRETSLIEPLTLLLFHGESLRRGHSPEKNDEDNVLLRINNTNVKFLCPVKDANLIEECRVALRHCENYFVRGYTSSDVDFQPPTRWHVVLQTLKQILCSR